jgi:hypothetical protein
MTPETVTLAIRANLAWGDAREHLGRVRERADADPTETNRAAEAEARAVAQHAWLGQSLSTHGRNGKLH